MGACASRVGKAQLQQQQQQQQQQQEDDAEAGSSRRAPSSSCLESQLSNVLAHSSYTNIIHAAAAAAASAAAASAAAGSAAGASTAAAAAAAAAATAAAAAASAVNDSSTADFGILVCIRGECCDILLEKPELQMPSSAALLKTLLNGLTRSAIGAGSQDRSKVFLENLLGCEGAQAALAAVLRGSHYTVVLEKEMPASDTSIHSRSSSPCSSLQQSAAKLAKLALPAEGSQRPYPGPLFVQLKATSGMAQLGASADPQMQQQQQQQQQFALLPMTVAAERASSNDTPSVSGSASSSFIPNPIQDKTPKLTPLLEDSSKRNSFQDTRPAPGGAAHTMTAHTMHLEAHTMTAHTMTAHTMTDTRPAPGGAAHTMTAFRGCGGFLSSQLPPLPGNSQSSRNMQDFSFAHTSSNVTSSNLSRRLVASNSKGEFPSSLSSQDNHHASSNSLQLNPLSARLSSKSGGNYMDGSNSDLSGHTPRSKTLQLSSSALNRICPITNRSSSEYGRTMALLRSLYSDPNPDSSGEVKLATSNALDTTRQKKFRRPARKTVSCINLRLEQNGSQSTLKEVGLHIGDLDSGPVHQPPTQSSGHCSPATSVAWIASEVGGQTSMEDGGAFFRGALPHPTSSLDAENDNGGGAETACSSSGTSEDAEKHGSQKVVFELTLRPVPAFQGRHAVLLLSLIDISEQVQIQAALLSLAEGQLHLVSDLLPVHAIEFLARQMSEKIAISQNASKLARNHKMVTLMFMDICGFTTVAKAVEPHEIMEWLNKLFSCMDALTDKYKVQKVETAGDCYIVSAGVLSSEARDGFSRTLDRHDDHRASARCVMEFAKAVLLKTAKVSIPRTNSPVKVRIGLHSGDVVSGLIGSKLPKFSIFGDAMNTAARMESTGVPGRIHVSEATQGLLPEYAWESMGKIHVKGKGDMQTYLWDADKCPSHSGDWPAMERAASYASSDVVVEPSFATNVMDGY